MTPAVFRLRVWMAFITLVNFCIGIAFYAWLVARSNKYNTKAGEDVYKYKWTDVAMLIASLALFLAYLCSIWSKPRLHKFVRAALMLLPALFLLGVQLRQIQLRIELINTINKRLPSQYGSLKPFSCDGSTDASCGILQSWTFIPVIVGFFVVIEVFVTLFSGVTHTSKSHV
ncbi:hypothetical protein BGW39_007323 [Mortierella sp. 14UC]|nr:hypothetical protein BGW39_007323 [Mortierella sp. 14UC]